MSNPALRMVPRCAPARPSVPAAPEPSTITTTAVWKLAYSKTEAAEMLSISESLINDLIDDGSIRTVSAGRRVLVPLVAMTDFLSGS